MTAAIHQITAGFGRGDAVSNEALALRRIFRAWGHPSHIFSEQRRILPELRHTARDISACIQSCRPGDIAILHLSIGSLVNDLFAELPCRKVIRYHNITPPEYLAGLQEQTARHLEWGRRQAARLAGTAEMVLAVSVFNAADLEQMGYRRPTVFPIVLDPRRLRTAPSRRVLKEYAHDRPTILFVGRCIPNKRIEDALHAFYYFQKYVEPDARFIHIGSFTGTEQYHALLMTLVNELDLGDKTFLLGGVRQDELAAFYTLADLFLCMSEHEGFCIPLLESMAHDLPVMAYAAGAVPETLDGAGILFHEKQFDLLAEMMGRLTGDGPLREAVLEGQRERLRRYEQRDLAAELRTHLAPLLSP